MTTEEEFGKAMTRLRDLAGWETAEGVNWRDSEDETALHKFCWRNDVQGVRLAIEVGADVNAKGDMGYTPLMIAASNARLEIVKALLDAGARTDTISEFGYTAYETAVLFGKRVHKTRKPEARAVIELLLKVPRRHRGRR